MKVAVTGANGMLGRRLVEAFQSCDVVPLSRAELDVTDYQAVSRQVARIRPDWILHTAAFTAVDAAEQEREDAFRVNATGTRNVAAAAFSNRAGILYYSTDYVFDGRSARPYQVWDTPNPINVYGRTKLEGERQIRDHCPRHLIVRTSWLYGPDGNNFVDKIAGLAQRRDTLRIVDDQIGCPTYTPDLASVSRALVAADLVGTYHVTNQGSCSWFELAGEIVRLTGSAARVTPVGSSEYPVPARRPAYSVLDNSLLGWDGVESPRLWPEALASHLGIR